MMRSLWAGVSGLQAHQVAMDVEGHNIANVNTVGYKYTRVSFADQISQTAKTATSPQGTSGGKNAMQVGLGTSVEAATKVFKAGSIEKTDVGTDLAIEDEGFFIVSEDGGKTYKYTRNGEFKFDANGNFTNNGGFIVQGWVRDNDKKTIDTTAPIKNIVIKPGLTTEAQASDYVTIKANLDSGNDVGKHKVLMNSLDSVHGAYDHDDNPATAAQAHNENSATDFKFNAKNEIVERGLDVGVLFDSNGDSYNLRNGQGIWVSSTDAVSAPQTITGPATYDFTLNGESVNFSTTGTAEECAQQLSDKINGLSSKTGVVATINGTQIVLKNDNRTGTTAKSKNINLTGTVGGGLAAVNVVTARRFNYTEGTANPSATPPTFKTTEDLRHGVQSFLNEGITPPTPDNAAVTVNNLGQFQIKRVAGGADLNIAITAFSSPDVAANEKFASAMHALDGVLSTDNSFRTSQSMYAAAHGTSIAIYDSLGSKHTVSFEYTKISQSKDVGTEWTVKISVPEPGVINKSGVGPENVVTGYVRFDDSGALSTYTPANLSFTPNNGATGNQNVELRIGTVGGYDGLTCYDSESTTSSIYADGYPGGDLETIRIDASGTLVGKFTNGRSFGLAQVALAKFPNNEGLETEGGNVFRRTPNSGDPIVGTADSGGRGSISASSLEMSNVDLSRSLTQLIVVQRGFQANSKTITTSDQMLNTLLQLKQ